MKVSAVTCTGDRHLCLDLLTGWIDHQTRKPDQWLIIDDGKQPYAPDYECDYYYREPSEEDPEFTMVTNLQEAIHMIEGDVILFMEDDEYYAPRYIETMVNNIKDYDLAGICRSKYYHLPSRCYYVHNNYDHASLAQTMIKRKLLDDIEQMSVENQFIDVKLWGVNVNAMFKPYRPKSVDNGFAVNNGKGFLFDDGDSDCLYVGMKGMPGRGGIGSGHKGMGRFDNGGMKLKQWMPKDFDTYWNIPFDRFDNNKLKLMMRGR